ncbi:hypothetical protein [Pseudoduganella sp. R-34]|uniref:hypothetical protein n=1 Tax=Pseudoduganella sp. R-34 TaxID=3404062 RepID=UPI003CF3C939
MNANNQPHQSGMTKFGAFLITLPYLALAQGGNLAQSFLNRPKEPQVKPNATPKAAPLPAAPEPKVIHNQRFEAANRVHSESIRGNKVCFYEYRTAGQIKATTRVNGFLKEVIFTREDANSMSLPFVIESAVVWIHRHGFEKKSVAEQIKPITTAAAPKSTVPQPRHTQPAVNVSRTQPSVQATKAPSRQPYEGEIVGFGTTTRPGRKGEPDFETYFMTVRHSRIGDREFIGEQLAELVDTHQLQIGQAIRLHQLGKRHFQVMVNGKPQDRTRNEYKVDIL